MPFSVESIRLVAKLQESASSLRDPALSEAYYRYFTRLVTLLRKRVPSYLARRCDPEDLAQSAWGSFVGGLDRGRINLADRDSLWPLIAHIALCKYHDLVASAHRGKRDIRREASFDGGNDPVPDLIDTASGPVEEAAADETVGILYSRLADDTQQYILALHLGGLLVREIADEVKLSERTVKRVLSKVRELYAELIDQKSDDGT